MKFTVHQDVDFDQLSTRELQECREEIFKAIVKRERFLQSVAFHDSNWILEMGQNTPGGWIEAIRKLRLDTDCSLRLAKEAVDMVRDSLKK